MLRLAEFKEKLSQEGTVRWPTEPPVEFFWSFELTAPTAVIWRHLSDTSRFNREMDLAPRTQTEHAGKVSVETTMLGLRQAWIEEPWTWLAERTITSSRLYSRGMAKTVHAVFHIDSESSASHRTVYIYFGWHPLNRFWGWFLRATERLLRRRFGQIFAKIDAHAKHAESTAENTPESAIESALQKSPAVFSTRVESKLRGLQASLLEKNLPPLLVERLSDLIRHGDDLELESIRIRSLAQRWNVMLRDLLLTCLHATRIGLLKISWEMICPHCRGSRFSAGSIGDIPESAACTVCEVTFTTDEANSIEVIFHVHPSIRVVESVMYCAAEPAKKSHIKIQQWVAPGQTLRLEAALSDGGYRARCVGEAHEVRFAVDGQCRENSLRLNTAPPLATVAGPVHFEYENTSAEPKLLVVEEMIWDNQALKPQDVFALPEFRDLFSEEHLNSNVKIYLGEQTILFTDIVGSTRFYNDVGDAKAFNEVRAHFQEVFAHVQAHQGVIVKTIGDAVMASFSSTVEAIRAAQDIQMRFSADRQDCRIRLRIAIHCGSVIAVRLNTGLDYFGNTVNYAAKIQSCAGAGEIALSEDAYRLFLLAKLPEVVVEKRKNQREAVVPTDVFVLKPQRSAGQAAS